MWILLTEAGSLRPRPIFSAKIRIFFQTSLRLKKFLRIRGKRDELRGTGDEVRGTRCYGLGFRCRRPTSGEAAVEVGASRPDTSRERYCLSIKKILSPGKVWLLHNTMFRALVGMLPGASVDYQRHMADARACILTLCDFATSSSFALRLSAFACRPQSLFRQSELEKRLSMHDP